MPWVYLDDRFPEHVKVERAGGDAAWLFVAGLCYVNRNLTGGTIPKTAVPRLTDRKSPMRLAERLVDVGLWEDEGDDFRIHDYEHQNRSAMARREKAKKAATARWSASPDDAPSIPPSNAPGNAPAMPPTRAGTRAPSPSPSPSPSVTTGSASSRLPAEGGRDETKPGVIIERAFRLVAERRLAQRNVECADRQVTGSVRRESWIERDIGHSRELLTPIAKRYLEVDPELTADDLANLLDNSAAEALASSPLMRPA